MTLEEYILGDAVQAWATAQGYDSFSLYPTGDPCIERDGKTYASAVPLDDFQAALEAAVAEGEDLAPGTLEEETEPEDGELVIAPII